MKTLILKSAVIGLFCSAGNAQLLNDYVTEALKINSTNTASVFLDYIVSLKQMYPNDPKIAFLFGTYQYRIGNVENAKNLFTKAIEQDKTCTLSYVARATIFAKNNDFEWAIEDLTTAMTFDKTNLQIRELRSQYYQKLGQFEKALVDLDAAIKLKPTRIDTYVAAANVCLELNNASRAMSYFAKAFVVPEINVAAVSIAYAEHLTQLQRFDDAIARYNDAIAQNPKQLTATDYNNLAVIYYKLNKFVQALPHALVAESMQPMNIDYKNNLAAVYFALESWKKAADMSEKALLVDAKNQQAISTLDNAQQQLKISKIKKKPAARYKYASVPQQTLE